MSNPHADDSAVKASRLPAFTDGAETSPSDSRAFRTALSRYPTGVAVITTRAPERDVPDVGMTMNSFSAVSLDPPLVLFCVDRHSLALPAWRAGRVFGISILSEGQHEISNRFAKANTDKWSGQHLRRGLDEVALIEGAFAHFECSPHAQYEVGDHVIFIVRVERYHITPRPGPLVFFQGRYNHLKPGPTAPFEWPSPLYY